MCSDISCLDKNHCVSRPQHIIYKKPGGKFLGSLDLCNRINRSLLIGELQVETIPGGVVTSKKTLFATKKSIMGE